jgi:uncharacterized cupin superfamily protein
VDRPRPIREAALERTDHGLLPQGDGWFVVNAREASWLRSDGLGQYCGFEGETAFPQLGVNLNVLRPGEPMAMYHREARQEDFLVLAGECVLVVEGEERPLRPWDLVHCPPGVDHVIVGAGDRPSLVFAVGARIEGDEGLVYPVDETARRHGAGVDVETALPREAYAPFSKPVRGPYRDGDLPDL